MKTKEQVKDWYTMRVIRKDKMIAKVSMKKKKKGYKIILSYR